MPQGGSTGDWTAAGTTDATSDSERLRRELRDAPRDLVDWEASCLKNIADLLDSLDRARVRWETLGEELKDTEERLDRAQEERDLLAESHSDAQKAREELRQVRGELEEIRRERDEVASDLVAVREQLETHLSTQHDDAAARREELAQATSDNARLRDELDTAQRELNAATKTAQRQQEDAADTERGLRDTVAKLNAEHADLQGRLIEVDLALEDEREKNAGLEANARASGDAAQRTEQAEQLQQRTTEKLARVEAEHEQNLVLLFDLRTRAERLVEKLDDADGKTRKKVRRIIDKVHAELDAAGAPHDSETSYGERIRLLGELLRADRPDR